MTNQQYDSLQPDVKEIIDTFNDEECYLDQSIKIRKQLNEIGWDCEIDADGGICDVYKITRENLAKKLEENFGMEANVYPYGQDVHFFGTEMECRKMINRFKGKKCHVDYSLNLETWYIAVYDWFDIDYAEKIEN